MRMRKNILALAVVALIAFCGFAGSAAAADVSDTLNLEITVENSCDIAVQDYVGSVSGASTETLHGQAGVVNVTCNFDTAYSVAMDDNGQNFGLGAGSGGDARRALSDGAGEYLSYNIFQDIDGLIPWGEDVLAKTGVGTGSLEQFYYAISTYYPNLVSDGVYTDAVPVTLTY